MRHYCRFSDAPDCSECNERTCPYQDDPESMRDDCNVFYDDCPSD